MSFIKDLTDKKESPGLPEPYPKYPTMAEVGITPRVELSDCQRCFGNDTHQQRLRGSLGQPVDVREIYQSAESRSCKGCSLFQQLILRAQEYMASPIKRIRFEISPGIGYHSRMLLIQENGETHEMGFGFDSLRSLCCK
jgi:hypothetical protein